MMWTIIALAGIAAVLLVLVLIALGMRALGSGGAQNDYEYEDEGVEDEEYDEEEPEDEEEEAPKPRARAARRPRSEGISKVTRRLRGGRNRDDEDEGWGEDSGAMSDDDFWSSLSKDDDRPGRSAGARNAATQAMPPLDYDLDDDGDRDHDGQAPQVPTELPSRGGRRSRAKAAEPAPAGPAADAAPTASSDDTVADHNVAVLASLGNGEQGASAPQTPAPAAQPPAPQPQPTDPFTSQRGPASPTGPGTGRGSTSTPANGDLLPSTSWNPPSSAPEPVSAAKDTDPFSRDTVRGAPLPSEVSAQSRSGHTGPNPQLGTVRDPYDTGSRSRGPWDADPARHSSPAPAPSFDSDSYQLPAVNTGGHHRPAYDPATAHYDSGQQRSQRSAGVDPLTDPSFTPPAAPSGPTDSPIWSSMDTGSHQRPAMDTGSHQRPAMDTGSHQRPAMDTGSHQRPAMDTGSHQRPAMDTGSHQRPAPQEPPGYPSRDPYSSNGPISGPLPSTPSTTHGASSNGVPVSFDGEQRRESRYETAAGPYHSGNYSPTAPTGEYPGMRGVTPSSGNQRPDYQGYPEPSAPATDPGSFQYGTPTPGTSQWGSQHDWTTPVSGPGPNTPPQGQSIPGNGGAAPFTGERRPEYPAGPEPYPASPGSPYTSGGYYPTAPTGEYPSMRGTVPPTQPYEGDYRDALSGPVGAADVPTGAYGPPGPPAAPGYSPGYEAPSGQWPNYHTPADGSGRPPHEEEPPGFDTGPYRYGDGMFR